MQLERIPNVGTFLQVLHVAVQAAECRGHGQHSVLQFTEVQGVELLQLICDRKCHTRAFVCVLIYWPRKSVTLQVNVSIDGSADMLKLLDCYCHLSN